MSSATNSPILHRCNVCFKTYKRREHLQRHRSSHSSERPHRCVLCNASFQRTDVLKRHLQTCDGTSGSTAGRRRACDRCVRQKKACSSSQPCQNCAKRGVDCQYPNTNSSSPGGQLAPTTETGGQGGQGPDENQRDVESFHPSTDAPSFDPVGVHFDQDFDALIQEAASDFLLFVDDGHMQELSHDWLGTDFKFSNGGELDETSRPEPSCGSSTSDYHGYSFNFLYDFTSRSGLVSSFDCGTLSQRIEIIQSFHYPYSTHKNELPSTDYQPFGNSAGEFSQLEGGTHFDHDFSASSSWAHDPVLSKLDDIVLLVKEVVTVKPNNSTVKLSWSAALEQECRRFFSPARFARFIELYWSVWHCNVNIIHRPSFDVVNCKPILLASMTLIGKSSPLFQPMFKVQPRSDNPCARGMRIAGSGR